MKKIFLIITLAALVLIGGCKDANTESAEFSSQISSSVSASQITEFETESNTAQESSSELSATVAHDFETSATKEGLNKNIGQTEKIIDNTDKAQNQQSIETGNYNIPQNNSKDETANQSTKEPEVNKRIATASDEEWIENRVIELFNNYRNTSLMILSGLSSYDKARSIQLVNNFAHDADDERSAATELKYGQHIQEEETIYDFESKSIIYTGNMLDYYCVNAREAIGRGGIVMRSPEMIAGEIAEGFKNSSGHWSYLGSDEYKYVGCGVTIIDGNWYCCASVAITNIDINP